MKRIFKSICNHYKITENEHLLMNVVIGPLVNGKAGEPILGDLLELNQASGIGFGELIRMGRKLRGMGVLLYHGEFGNMVFEANNYYKKEFVALKNMIGELDDQLDSDDPYVEFSMNKMFNSVR